jgi:hypothetical protein
VKEEVDKLCLEEEDNLEPIALARNLRRFLQR